MKPHCSCILLVCACALIGCASLRASRTSTIAQSPQPQLAADAARGAMLFTANCASCHGATGREGGFGPSLTHENRKMDTEFAIAWIENPNPPMPKLYPSPLSAQDVADIAAYVESL
ncbi:MAG TPA: cytochrome c [Candidatus Baltobacteraceae bacterium]|nr:cytochrome c [Candidatus Baltobacteraceae bacterium]